VKRVKIEEKLLWIGGPIGTYQHSFERYRPRTPTASYFLILGVRNPHPKFAIIAGTDKARDFKFIGSIRTKAH